MESKTDNQEEVAYNQESEMNRAELNAESGGPNGGILVSEKTEDVTVDTDKLDKQESGLGEQNHGDDFLGKANKEEKE